MKRKIILTLYGLIFILCGCSTSKNFNKRLTDITPRIKCKEQRTDIKYFDTKDTSYYYLLTIYRTFEKSPNEDFSFEGVNTYKKNTEVNKSAIVNEDAEVVQFLALYFFKNGGVVYHLAYKNDKSEYIPLKIEKFKDFYGLSTKTEGALMHGYISDHINTSEINQTVNTYKKTRTDSIYRDKDNSLLQLATRKLPDSYDSLQTDEINDSLQIKKMNNSLQIKKSNGYFQITITNDSSQTKKNNKSSVANRKKEFFHTIYLEGKVKNGKNKPAHSMYLLVKNLPLARNKEGYVTHGDAVIIEQVYYQKDVNTTKAIYTQALVEEVFNFGTANNDDTVAKLWFRLQPEQPKDRKK